MSCVNSAGCKVILIVMIVLIFKFNISEIFILNFENYCMNVSIHLS